MRDDTPINATPMGPKGRSHLYALKCFTVGDARSKGRDWIAKAAMDRAPSKATMADIERSIGGWTPDHGTRDGLVHWLRHFARNHGCAPYLHAAANMLEADGRALDAPKAEG